MFNALLPVGCDPALGTFGFEKELEAVSTLLIIVHEQKAAALKFIVALVKRVDVRVICGTGKGDAEPETAANSWGTLDSNGSPHQFNQTLGDGKSKSRPLDLCLGILSCLFEGLEQARNLVSRNPASRISDLESKGTALTWAMEDRCIDFDPSRIGKFDGVA